VECGRRVLGLGVSGRLVRRHLRSQRDAVLGQRRADVRCEWSVGRGSGLRGQGLRQRRVRRLLRSELEGLQRARAADVRRDRDLAKRNCVYQCVHQWLVLRNLHTGERPVQRPDPPILRRDRHVGGRHFVLEFDSGLRQRRVRGLVHSQFEAMLGQQHPDLFGVGRMGQRQPVRGVGVRELHVHGHLRAHQ